MISVQRLDDERSDFDQSRLPRARLALSERIMFTSPVVMLSPFPALERFGGDLFIEFSG